MFEEEQSGASGMRESLEASGSPESPGSSGSSGLKEAPEKRISSVVLLAAGGVLVATVCATLASLLAGGGSKPEAGPPKAQAEVEESVVETSTSFSVAPDGSTSTVVITVSGKPKGDQERVRNAAATGVTSGEQASEVVVTSVESTSSEQQTTRRPTSNPPTTRSQPSTASSSAGPVETSVSVPERSEEPGEPVEP
ncbi:hypothetical protein [Umezawaea sp. Da 62-37]|uniref:hypothetical protein n=1 Tax=Umezawaea sp. Da 62-37 TaxID=3075927 RepID=UPI0028F6E3DB|nr:hypothetical protein [Umezawaea sp. Da 62-37]WNV89931.1 hypothetical protein RM788_17015 [Umezawaea sp. Da 62-37]